MKCLTHTDNEAIGTCVNCGSAICFECQLLKDDRNFCSQKCYASFIGSQRNNVRTLREGMKQSDVSIVGRVISLIVGCVFMMVTLLCFSVASEGKFFGFSGIFNYVGYFFLLLGIGFMAPSFVGLLRQHTQKTSVSQLIDSSGEYTEKSSTSIFSEDESKFPEDTIKTASRQENLMESSTPDQWECPRCKKTNVGKNTKCEHCGFSLV